jgi:hypothetical protein
MISAALGWRAVFLLDHGGVSRQVAFWCVETIPFGVVADDDGVLRPAHEMDGFAGYADPDDDPEKLISSARRRAKEKESTS